MKVHLIVPIFPPEAVASAVMAEHIAIGLSAQRHEVTVLTSFPSKMKGVLFPGYRRTLRQMASDPRGFRLCRVFTIFSTTSSVASRLPEYLSFALASNLASLCLGRPDVVFINTWPLATLVTAAICSMRGVPFVFNTQDLYPESAGGLGYLRSGGLLYRLLLWLDRAAMGRAAHVVPISEEFAAHIQATRGVSPDRMTVIWNWFDGRVRPQAKQGLVRAQFLPSGQGFIVMYAGNVGSVAGLEVVLEAAKLLRHRGPYVFVLAGDGTMRERLERQCRTEDIRHVRFLYPLHRDNLSEVQAAADVMLITVKRGLARSEVPSKMMGYMLSGRPILAMVDRESNTARLVGLANCGLVAEPENPQMLASLVTEMHAAGAKLDEWGERARQFALTHFSQERNTLRMIAVLERAAATRSSLAGSPSPSPRPGPV